MNFLIEPKVSRAVVLTCSLLFAAYAPAMANGSEVEIEAGFTPCASPCVTVPGARGGLEYEAEFLSDGVTVKEVEFNAVVRIPVPNSLGINATNGETAGLVKLDLTRLNPSTQLVESYATCTMVLRKAAGNSLIYALKLSAELKNDQVVAGKNSLGFCDIDLITANVQSGSDDRTVTRLTLTRSDSTGTWNTINDTKWALGAAASFDALLYNGADSAVNFPLSDGGSFNIFAADASSGSGYFTAGSVFTLTAEFSDGSSASAITILPSPPPPPSAPTLTLSFDGKLRDRVGRADAALSADGSLDGTFTVTVQPSILAIQEGDLAFISVNGTDILSALLETEDDDEDDDD